MFFYVYDKMVGSKKNARKFGQMQTKLNELGILNDKSEVSTINSIESIVDSALSSGRCQNIIAVGDDSTAHNTLNALLKTRSDNKDVVFGFIPFQPSSIAKTLGMPDNISQACLAISRRKLENIDIAYTNEGTCFINSLDIHCKSLGSNVEKVKNLFSRDKKQPVVTIKVRDFTITTSSSHISVCNTPSGWENILDASGIDPKRINPQDGLLDLITHNPESEDSKQDTSFISSSKIEIISQDKINIIADNTKKLRPPLKIGVGKKLLPIIVGKERVF